MDSRRWWFELIVGTVAYAFLIFVVVIFAGLFTGDCASGADPQVQADCLMAKGRTLDLVYGIAGAGYVAIVVWWVRKRRSA